MWHQRNLIDYFSKNGSPAANSGLAKVAVSFSADKLEVNQTFVLRIKYSAKNRHLSHSAERYHQC